MTVDSGNGGPALGGPLAAAVALVVAVLAAIGVSGELLARAVRNDPNKLAVSVIAILVITGSWLARNLYLAGQKLGLLPLGLLILTLCGVVLLGAQSVAEREIPPVSLSASTEQSLVTVDVVATAAGVPSYTDVLVQVIALREFGDDEAQRREICGMSRIDNPPPTEVAMLVSWQHAGPDGAGNVEHRSSFQVPDEFEALCAFGALQNIKGREPRSVVSYLRLPQK